MPYACLVITKTARSVPSCSACPVSTNYNGTGANSSALCHLCAAGKYNDKEGMGTCSTCPTGQYQPDTGKSNCMECNIDELKTNNADHTGCIVNEHLRTSSAVSLAKSVLRWCGVVWVIFCIHSVHRSCWLRHIYTRK